MIRKIFGCLLALSMLLSAALAEEAVLTVQPDTSILFQVDKPTVDDLLGTPGVLTGEGESEYGYPIVTYTIRASWFGWQPLDTDFIYRKMGEDDLALDRLLIRTAELGLSDAELESRLTEAVGQPLRMEGADPLWGGSTMAENPSLRQYLLAQEQGETCIEVISYIHHDVGQDIQRYDLSDENPAEGTDADKALLLAVQKLIPANDSYVRSVVSWTDGYGYVVGSCLADDMSRSDSFTIRMDRYDFFEDDGTLKKADKFVSTVIHEYAHALTLNESQMNTALMYDTISYQDISLYRADSYMQAFYDRFYAPGQRLWKEHPEDYVSQYAGTAGIHEDIAESFLHFVTQDRPGEESSLAAQKLLFFYDYPELVEIRDVIREGLE